MHLLALVVKHAPANAGDVRDAGLIPGQEDPLEEDKAAHSSVLAWRTPWTEEEMTAHPSVMPGEPHGQRSLVGHSPRGHKSRTPLNENTACC